MVCWTAYVPLVREPSIGCVFLWGCGLGVDLCRSVWGCVQCGERGGLGRWGSECVHTYIWMCVCACQREHMCV